MVPTDSEVIGQFANAAVLDIQLRDRACLALARRYVHVVESVIPWHNAVDLIHDGNRNVPKGEIAAQLLTLDDVGKLSVSRDPQYNLILKTQQ